MRDGIVHMQKVEIVELRNFSHAGRERKVIRRVVEQRVAGDFHLVIVDVRLLASEANGLCIGDEMDFVPALRQLQAKFRGDNSTTAVRRITGDSDLHVRGAAFSWFLSFDGWNGQWLQILHECRGGNPSGGHY
jgi:hypothetical protein